MGEPVRDQGPRRADDHDSTATSPIRISRSSTSACGPARRLDERLWSEDELPLDTEYPRIKRVERKKESGILILIKLLEALRPRSAASISGNARTCTGIGFCSARPCGEPVPTVMIPEHERPVLTNFDSVRVSVSSEKRKKKRFSACCVPVG